MKKHFETLSNKAHQVITPAMQQPPIKTITHVLVGNRLNTE